MKSISILTLSIILITLSISTSLAQVTTTHPDLSASEKTLEEYMTGLYAELMEEYILHHNTDLYANHTTEDLYPEDPPPRQPRITSSRVRG